MNQFVRCLSVGAAAFALSAAQDYRFSEPPQAVEPEGPIQAVVLHPIFADYFNCGEHPAGEESIVGDALGTDCQIVGGVFGENRSFARQFRTDGKTNADWFSWQKDVLAPIDGVVTGLFPNAKVNEPGQRGKPPAAMIQITRDDGLVVVLAHVTDFAIKLDQRVKAGDVVAKVGNNGPSYAPHVHVGAYRGVEPLQIRWDQRAAGKLYKKLESPAGQ
ncbi:M23 family metallopeptidase [Sphingomonas sabuli]|uniref:M23 family metallopeptidase n=1 Tax=Sphingomonas sabuli TaxID=2764186 RepID=A0A7G9L1U0_9SPHN|nr:M23 family metallopeptidase [Sphingomonas sabuli]QNM82589.1 M23 family metallopeptidase [Sphingomonas sabuli]